MTDTSHLPAKGPALISASLLFDEKRTSRFVVATVFALCFLLLGAAFWAARMPITEISTSTGEIVTSSAVQRVQHLEGGIVAQVHIEEGAQVTQGDALLTFAPKIAATELSQLRTRHSAARVRINLLSAALDGALPDPNAFKADHRPIVKAEITALRTRRNSFAHQVTVLVQQRAEREAALKTVQVRLDALAREITLTTEKKSGQTILTENGNFSRMQLLDTERDLSRLEGEHAAMQSEKKHLHQSILSVDARIEELHANFEAELAAEISALTGEAAELDLAISQADDRVDRLRVTAPISGRIQDLQIRSDGGVVAPGALLMNIIPDNASLQVEARVSTRDIGHVEINHPVKIKVQTFDYSRFGTIRGYVSQISPTTFLDAQGEPYFKAIVALDSNHVGDNEKLQLVPGMTVEVDIITGTRSLLNYLITPILKSLDSGLHER